MTVGRLAGWYRWIEYAAFGRALERSRFAFLDRLRDAHHVLVLGEGDGRVVERLLAAAPHAQVDVIEASAEMIALAQSRVGDCERVRFLCEDARRATLAGGYDGIVTCFFLDCFTAHEACDLIRRLAGALDGVWLVSEFAIPASGWRRWHAQVWIWTMYRFFGVATGLQARELPPIERLLSECGMVLADKKEQRWGMIVSEVWQKR